MRLFTVDMEYDNMEEKPYSLLSLTIKEKKQIREAEKKKLMRKLESGRKTTWAIYVKDKDFKELRRKFDAGFNEKFGKAYESYIEGNWQVANDLFS